MLYALILAAVFLGYANGANDNSKGVATLMGSHTLSYRAALLWATLTTFAGSLTALWVSTHLVATFSGKGLVPMSLTTEPAFLCAVGLGAAMTVMIATRLGLPISTTHALTGALVGAGFAAIAAVHGSQLLTKFVLPLALSPLIAVLCTLVAYPCVRYIRVRCGIARQMCLCIDNAAPQAVQMQSNGSVVLMSTGAVLTVAESQQCMDRYAGRVLGCDSQWMVDKVHVLSAGAVSFARGLNDTPKIAALLIASQVLAWPSQWVMMLMGIAIAAGGWCQARRVAYTMSNRITGMNHGQGCVANMVTALLVIWASRWGIPVSTTHVSCGALIGLGVSTGQGRWHIIRQILVAWVVTLPVAATCAYLCYTLLV